MWVAVVMVTERSLASVVDAAGMEAACGLVADAEVLLLVAASLQALKLQNWHLIVGEAGITRS